MAGTNLIVPPSGGKMQMSQWVFIIFYFLLLVEEELAQKNDFAQPACQHKSDYIFLNREMPSSLPAMLWFQIVVSVLNYRMINMRTMIFSLQTRTTLKMGYGKLFLL